MFPRLAVWLVSFGLFCGLSARAAEPRAADILPATTVIYAEVAEPMVLVDAVCEHPLRKQLEALPEYKELTQKNRALNRAKLGLSIFQVVAGRMWHDAVRDVTGSGLFVAVDGKTKGVVLLAHAPNEANLNDLRDRLLKAALNDAKSKEIPEPFEESEYRGHKFYKTNNSSVFGTIGQWLIATNNSELGRAVANHLLDGGKDTLANQRDYQAARKSAADESAAWVYLNIKSIRDADLAKQFYRDKSDNFGAELFVGGILAALKQADSATLSAELQDEHFRIELLVPHDRSAIPEEKEFYFGPAGQGVAPLAIVPERNWLSLASYRDMGQMWQRRADLFDENANAQLSQGDANLSAVFAGMDFGSEVLSALGPQVQIVSTAQDFDGSSTRVPKVKLPAFALLFQLKEPEKMRRQLKVSFQSLIGLTNLGAGQNGLPQLELRTEDIDGGHLVSAGYDASLEASEVSNDIIFNFSPSLGFVGNHFIVSSTRELAVELMELAEGDSRPSPTADRVVNTNITIDNDLLRNILEANRQGLIAQNMLEKGHSREDAEREISGVFAILKLIDGLSLELATDDNELQLELEVGFTQGK